MVQPYAEGLYLMRAPKLYQVKELYERVIKVAQGAAMMTETTVEIEFIKACSNTVLNTTLLKVMQKNLEEIPFDFFDQQDMDLAARIVDSLEERGRYFEDLVEEIQDPEQRRTALTDCANPHSVVLPMARERQGFVSSDVGDGAGTARWHTDQHDYHAGGGPLCTPGRWWPWGRALWPTKGCFMPLRRWPPRPLMH